MADCERQFLGRDEPLPPMGAGLEPAQDVFRPDDGEGEAFQGAVEGRGEEEPAGLQERSGLGDETRGSATCSTTSNAVMTSNRASSAANSSTVAAR